MKTSCRRNTAFTSDTTERRVVDYIAGMTDQYALRLAEELRKRSSIIE